VFRYEISDNRCRGAGNYQEAESHDFFALLCEAVIWIGATSNLCTPLFIVVGPKHPWREAGPPNHLDGKVDSDQ
jgi:hypothetical protein